MQRTVNLCTNSCSKAPSLPQPFSLQAPRHKRTRCMQPTAALPVEITDAVYAKELKHAQHAVRLASKLCRVVQRQLASAEKVSKQDDSPVTVADYGAQVIVAWALSRADPQSRLSLVAEEDSSDLRKPDGRRMLERITELVNTVLVSEIQQEVPLSPEQVLDLIDLGAAPGGASGRYWVLDPIDGTRGFVGMRQYAVCLGMLQDGEVMLGILGCPNLPLGKVSEQDGGSEPLQRLENSTVGCLFFAHRGHGAYVEPLWDDSKAAARLSVEDTSDISNARFMESYESRHSNHTLTAQLAKQVGMNPSPLRMDSQVKYGLLSRGDANVFMRFPPATYREKIWDHCAGFVIVEEAGGKVTDGSGRRLDFSRGRYLDLQEGIVAATPKLHAAALDGLKQLSVTN